MKYVLGFLFSADMQSVALIHKNKPAWQRGKFNGIGGKLEDGETAVQAMYREFLEETGVITDPMQWKYHGIMRRVNLSSSGEEFECFVFSMCNDAYIQTIQTKTDELVEVVKLSELNNQSRISNLDWLISFIKDVDYKVFDVIYD